MGPGPTYEVRPVASSQVVAPGDLIAIGDANLLQLRGVHYDRLPVRDTISGVGYLGLDVNAQPANGEPDRIEAANRAMRLRHAGRFTIVFCDAHVEAIQSAKLFSRDEAALKRWNMDHLPHAELIAP